MHELDDTGLLREYVERGSEEAFATLVARHINKVYSVALRHTGNSHQAGEITQAVFVILARKAARLGKGVVLYGWLYQTARLTAVAYIRSEIRRARREQEAYMQTVLNEVGSDVWTQIAPLLDAALARLNETDRRALVLRFFYGKSMREIGADLGANEEATRQRVNRALEKLHAYFLKRGVTSTAETIAGAISANSVQFAPVALAKSVTAVALANGATASSSTLPVIKGALKLMAWAKAKMAIVAGVVVVLAAGTTTVTVREIRQHNDSVWDTGQVTARLLEKAPHIVRIIPTKFPNQTRWGDNGKVALGIGVSVTNLVESAYGSLYTRIVYLTPIPKDKYDFIANLPSGSKEALAREIQKQFGIVGRFETIETNVLFLQVVNPNAPGLMTSTRTDNSGNSNGGSGERKITNGTMDTIAFSFEGEIGIPIVDQTGLTGRFDTDLKWDDRNDPEHENFKQALKDQLGLELVAGTAPVKLLVLGEAR
jgi:uncharacterized protein (TIGR03435 family)